MFKFFDFIGDFLYDFVGLLMDATTWVFTKIFIMMLPVLSWFMELSSKAVTKIIQDTNTATELANSWASLPQEVIYIATILQIPTAIGIILSAYAIRLIIKMIPGL